MVSWTSLRRSADRPITQCKQRSVRKHGMAFLDLRATRGRSRLTMLRTQSISISQQWRFPRTRIIWQRNTAHRTSTLATVSPPHSIIRCRSCGDPRRLAEGWALNTIVTAQSGRPVPIVSANDTSAFFNDNFNTRSNFHQRPNRGARPNPINSNWESAPDFIGYLNGAAFEQPADGDIWKPGPECDLRSEILERRFRALEEHPDLRPLEPAIPRGVLQHFQSSKLRIAEFLC